MMIKALNGALAPAALTAFLALSPRLASGEERLVHAEDFTKAAAYDSSFWLAETGFFRNKEAQYYQPANVSVKNGALVLEGRREHVDNRAYDPHGSDWLTTTKSADYTSGSILTKRAFTFGIFEVVASLPQSQGVWPAIWTIDETSGPYREIDVVEAVGQSPGKAFTTVYAGPDIKNLAHWSAETPVPDLAERFHTYRLEWRRDRIVVSIDGREVLRMNPAEADKNGVDPLREPMRLRINLALGGSWGGAIDDKALPAEVRVKSVKIWETTD